MARNNIGKAHALLPCSPQFYNGTIADHDSNHRFPFLIENHLFWFCSIIYCGNFEAEFLISISYCVVLFSKICKQTYTAKLRDLEKLEKIFKKDKSRLNLMESKMCQCNFIVIHCEQNVVSPYPGGQLNQNRCDEVSNDFSQAQIILFFAPVKTNQVGEQLVVYYNNPKFVKDSDIIAIYAHDSVTESQLNIIYSFSPSRGTGFKYTNISPTNLSYNKNSTFRKQCLGYSGAWLRNGDVKKMVCLSTHPDWMEERKDNLRKRTIPQLFIPGTLDSGSYLRNKSQLNIDMFHGTQDLSILEQLVSGARYLDLRPSVNYEYYVSYGANKRNLMKDIIKDVKEFLDNTDEIVILSFTKIFLEFDSDLVHDFFIKYLEEQFAGYFLPVPGPYEWDTPLGDIWKSGKRLILSYNHDDLRKNRTSLWSPIAQLSDNVHDLKTLKYHLISAEQEIIEPKATMAGITSEIREVENNSSVHLVRTNTTSLRPLGQVIGPYVTDWFNTLFHLSVNIVAVDFIDTTEKQDVEWLESMMEKENTQWWKDNVIALYRDCL
ncbi:hypothetical protein PV327_001522 [Microctonus hyperodae]|uniref:Phosphatidylinositol-specific phospholipase C X domain-containing protein n=1 Tax=Microctonus hyperodae TaxID=165561 RepID=A0AA39G9F4_MICHY|nr:hypothetical protein PV327_001522 [Microctonus hyperodae]